MKLVWVAAGCAAMSTVALVAYVSSPTPRELDTFENAPETASAEAWCAGELEALKDEVCFAAPPRARSPVPLLVYLHGRYSDEELLEELDRQSRLTRLATQRGFAVLALRGVRGECTSSEYASYYCWPSNERNASDGPRFASRIAASIALVRARLGPGANVLLGFSNGGYFASLIATRALVPFDAIAVAHGGPVDPLRRPAFGGSGDDSLRRPAFGGSGDDSLHRPAGDASAATPLVPMLLVTADDDAADPEMRKLDSELSLARWPHALVAREGGHSLTDWDLDVSVTFFERTLGQGFPFEPRLPSRSKRPSIGGAGAEVPSDGGVDLRDF